MTRTALSFASKLMLGCCLSLGMATVAQARPFQQYKNGSCPTQICDINFDKVANGKTLTVSNVSCYVRIDDEAYLYSVQLLVVRSNGSFASAVTLPVDQTDSLEVGESFASNDTVFAFATGGQRFRAQAQIQGAGGAFQQFACHISGQLD